MTFTKDEIALILLALELLEARDQDAAASDEVYRQMTKAQHTSLVSVRQKLKEATS